MKTSKVFTNNNKTAGLGTLKDFSLCSARTRGGGIPVGMANSQYDFRVKSFNNCNRGLGLGSTLSGNKFEDSFYIIVDEPQAHRKLAELYKVYEKSASKRDPRMLKDAVEMLSYLLKHPCLAPADVN